LTKSTQRQAHQKCRGIFESSNSVPLFPRRAALQPESQHSPGYPSAVDVDLSRRWFLRSSLAVTASGGLLGAAAVAGARGKRRRKPPKRPKHEVRFRFRSLYTFEHSNYRFEKIVVGINSDRLAAFLGDRKEAPGLEKALRRVLDRHTCASLVDGKKLARLQHRLARAVTRRYRKRTRSRVPTPSVALYVGVRYRACRGKCRAPTPYCRAPKAPRRRPRPRR